MHLLVESKKVNEIEPKAHSITLADGKVLSYSQLVLALGAKPILIPMDGDAVQDVLSVNNLADYAVFREKLVNAKRVAIIGPGLIGCEFANDLLNVGIAVSIIGPSDYPMNNLLPDIIAKDLQHHLEKLGADWHLPTTTQAVNRTEKDTYILSLENGDKIEADLVCALSTLSSWITCAD